MDKLRKVQYISNGEIRPNGMVENQQKEYMEQNSASKHECFRCGKSGHNEWESFTKIVCHSCKGRGNLATE